MHGKSGHHGHPLARRVADRRLPQARSDAVTSAVAAAADRLPLDVGTPPALSANGDPLAADRRPNQGPSSTGVAPGQLDFGWVQVTLSSGM